MAKAIVIMGKPASGKSTIAKALAEKLGIHYTSTGDLARGLPFAAEWQYLGLMAPEEAMRKAFEEDVEGHDIVVIDGMPRKLEQVGYLDAMFNDIHYYLIHATDKQVEEKLTKRGRGDDIPIAIRQRLEDFRTLTGPAIDEVSNKHQMPVIPAYIGTEYTVNLIQYRFRGGPLWE